MLALQNNENIGDIFQSWIQLAIVGLKWGRKYHVQIQMYMNICKLKIGISNLFYELVLIWLIMGIFIILWFGSLCLLQETKYYFYYIKQTNNMEQSKNIKKTEEDLICPASPIRTTNATSFFHSTGRQTRANWSNRVVKDFNDLTYDIKYNQLVGKGDLVSPNQFRLTKKLRSNGKVQNSSNSTWNQSFKGNSNRQEGQKTFDKHSFRLELMQSNKVYYPEQLQIVQKQLYSTLDTQGLCKFQFDKTIAGRLKNHFKNQTFREKHSLSYDESPDSLSKSSIKKNTCLSFRNYSPHALFQKNPESPDKFYETDNYFKTVRPKTIKETYRLSGVKGRVEPPRKESAGLDYEEFSARKNTMKSVHCCPIGKQKRNIQFGRQVIFDGRGCYR